MPQASRITGWSTSPAGAGNAIGVHTVASRSSRCRRRAESRAGRPGGRRPAPARRSASTPSRAVRGDAAGEPNRRQIGLTGDRLRQRGRRPRLREPFEAMPQASRIPGWPTRRETGGGNAIGAHAVASGSRRCRRRAESPAGRPRWKPAPATRSASTPSRAVRGDAAGEPNHGCSTSLETDAGNAIGVHAVASRWRRCRRRVEPPAGRPRRQPAPATRSASTPSRAVRGDAAGEPNHQLVDLARIALGGELA